VPALYRRILDLFSTIRAFFHKHFLSNPELSLEWRRHLASRLERDVFRR
jgi:succinylglutamate desuccinylase